MFRDHSVGSQPQKSYCIWMDGFDFNAVATLSFKLLIILSLRKSICVVLTGEGAEGKILNIL